MEGYSVNSSTGVHSNHNDLIKSRVPPVDINCTPSVFNFFRISSNPSLWKTEINAVLIFFEEDIMNCITLMANKGIKSI